jgi:hypothetical protein
VHSIRVLWACLTRWSPIQWLPQRSYWSLQRCSCVVQCLKLPRASGVLILTWVLSTHPWIDRQRSITCPARDSVVQQSRQKKRATAIDSEDLTVLCPVIAFGHHSSAAGRSTMWRYANSHAMRRCLWCWVAWLAAAQKPAFRLLGISHIQTPQLATHRTDSLMLLLSAPHIPLAANARHAGLAHWAI